jgi:hypothetical protein
MSDYIPNPPNPDRDPRNYDRYYEPSSGKGLTLVVGVLVAIAIVAGLMFFASNKGNRTEQAQLPDRTMSAPAEPMHSPSLPSAAPTTPAAPGNPVPGTPSPAVPRQ